MLELFRTPAYYLKEMTGKWSVFEKPYLDENYGKMQRKPLGPTWGSGFKGGGKPYGYRKWIFQWGPSPCWVGVANPECGTEFEIEAGIALPPPHSLQARAIFSATSSDPTKVWLVKIEPSGWSSFDATLHFQAKAEWEGTVTICVRASLEGQYLSEVVFQVPEQYQGGLSLEQAFSGTNLVSGGSTLGGSKEISRQYQGGLYNDPEAKKPGVFEGASNRLNLDIATSQMSTPTSVGDSPGRDASGSMDCGCIDVTVTCDTCDDSMIAWDDATSADTIARNGSATVAITDSLDKGWTYTWGVSGTGFTLDNVITGQGVLTNTLRADATACGVATVTVTGCDGRVVTGSVLCTTGTWVLTLDEGAIPGNCTWCTCTLYEGIYKYVTTWCWATPGSAPYCGNLSGCRLEGSCAAYGGGTACQNPPYCCSRHTYEWRCS